jgi:hypothetical protein
MSAAAACRASLDGWLPLPVGGDRLLGVKDWTAGFTGVADGVEAGEELSIELSSSAALRFLPPATFLLLVTLAFTCGVTAGKTGPLEPRILPPLHLESPEATTGAGDEDADPTLPGIGEFAHPAPPDLADG